MARLSRLSFIAGKKRSGKDFVADRLVAEAGYKKLHIVEGWLREWGIAHDLDPDQWETWKAVHRAAIQRDSAAARAADPEVLLRRFEPLLMSELAQGPVVVTAIRFINESLWGMQRGAFVVKVETPREERARRFLASGDDLALLDDPFEADLDRADFPCHVVVPGTLAAELYVPIIGTVYEGMRELMREGA